MAIRQRCRFCGSPVCSPSSSVRASSCLARPRSLRSRWSALIPTYMSGVPRSTGPSCSALGRDLQGLLVGAHRVAQPALGDPDVSQRDRARRVRRTGVPLAAFSPCTRRTPRGPPRDRRSSRTRSRSGRWPLRARHRRPRRRGPGPAGRGPPCREDRPAPAPARPGGRRCRPAAGWNSASSATTIRARGHLGPRTCVRPVEPALGVLQVAVDPLDGSGGQQCRDVAVAEHRPDLQQLLGQQLDPAAQQGLLPVPEQRRHRQLHQLRGPVRSDVRRSRAGSPRTARRCSANQSLARRCSTSTSSGDSSVSRALSTSANRWWYRYH